MSSLSTNVVVETEASNVEIDARIAELIKQIDATDAHTAEHETRKVEIAARITELQNEMIAYVRSETEVLKTKNTILREVIRRLDMINPTPCRQ